MNLPLTTHPQLSPGQWRLVQRALLVLCGALILLWTPLWNGYPLLHGDSGTYLASAMNIYAPVDRSIAYGLFIRTASLVNSLWFVILLQALGTSFLLYRTAELLLPSTPNCPWFAFSILVATVLTTTLSMRVGWVMPDLFASWLFLAGCIFVLTTERYERIAAAFLFALALWTHNSYIFIGLAVLLILATFTVTRRPWRASVTPLVLRLLLVWALAALLLGGINFYLRAGFTIARGGSTYVVNRLEQTGMLIRALDAECPGVAWNLCSFRDTIRTHTRRGGWFLWAQDSPLGTLGWDESAAEHDAIVRYIVACCLPAFAQKSAEASWRQFWMVNDSSPLAPLPTDSAAAAAVARFYPHEWSSFSSSAQQSGRGLPLRLIPSDEHTTPYLWLAAALGLWLATRVTRQWRLFLLWCTLFLFLVVNAIVMATVSGTAVRYQERILTLVPFLVFVSVAVLLMSYRRATSSAAQAHVPISTRGAP